jgi:hypothetical protein
VGVVPAPGRTNLQTRARVAAEAQKDKAQVEDKIDQAIRMMSQVDQNQGAVTHFETDHKSDKGTTRISVHSRPAQPTVRPPARQASGSCFVATACFGDYDHPTVRVLRQFRDQSLVRTATGRRLVSLYYRLGPRLAAHVERSPVIKPPIRFVLWMFATAYGLRHRTGRD